MPDKHSALQRFRDNPLRRLNHLSNYCEQRSMQALEDRGFDRLAMHFAAPMSLLAQRPHRLTELAERLAMSKQLCLQSLRPIEQAGYIERRSDSDDRRAKQIALSKRGEALIAVADEAMRAINEEFKALIGDEAVEYLGEFSLELCEQLGLPGFAQQRPAGLAGGLNFPLLIGLLNRSIHRSLMQGTMARGYDRLQMSHGQVLACIDPEGSSVGDIAALNAVSSQAISRVARQLSELGYIERRSDPNDGRSQRLVLSKSGKALVTDAVAVMDNFESVLQMGLGEAAYQRFTNAVNQLHSALFETAAPPATQTSSALSTETLLQACADCLEHRQTRHSAQLEQRLGTDGYQQLQRLLAFAAGRQVGRKP
ncbi:MULTISPECIES: MarR family transcriptional regulator [Spongiibacter]|uniref:MarR family winged helix-turn-helix transcriptional regulator n=1 Tax=Spongiibacter TaxID=630749 RepID=UPI001B10A7D5|nr:MULTISPECIES: MarR family transcriptional regulator [Spongiibacter]MBO6751491.1 MarR family transcriptional regulator [Spongiibacter sp.]|tara:strand:+ start:24862 stop:25965 length:1104 start_codon:yes stop_codon:yes gene_type:complete